MMIRTLATAGVLAGVAAMPAGAAVQPFTGATVSPAPAGTVTVTTVLDSFTTAGGTTSTLAPAASASAPGTPISGSEITRNWWGVDSTEIDGLDAALNLEVNRGVVNAGTAAGGGTPAKFMFGITLLDGGAAGDGNDIFLVELGGNDAFTLNPLDANGDAIGDFALSVTAASWGLFISDASNLVENTNIGGTQANSSGFAGLAFDLSDFVGTGTLSGVAGIQISSGDIDLSVVGYNTAAVPEPASLALMGLGALAMLRRRTA